MSAKQQPLQPHQQHPLPQTTSGTAAAAGAPDTEHEHDTAAESETNAAGAVTPAHRKRHRRQESVYMMTGLYSETGGDSNHEDDDDEEEEEDEDDDEDSPSDPLVVGSAAEATEMTGLTFTAMTAVPTMTPSSLDCAAVATDSVVINCHSRQASASLPPVAVGNVRSRGAAAAAATASTLGGSASAVSFGLAAANSDAAYSAISSQDCGLFACRPVRMQQFARIKIFVLLLSMLVTLQQALSSGYINSVITTIEKRFDIPSSYSGLIASSYEIGNVITVIFVSYLGSRRHIPVWIGIGAMIMGVGSLIFMVPHFTGDANPGISVANKSSDNICRGVSLHHVADMDLGRLSSGLASPPLAAHNNLREDNCIQGRRSTRGPVLMFVLAQLLLGCGGSPLFTLGTTYVDDHVRTESASMYIGCMYSMAAFGPVVGFLLGAYLLSYHMDSLAVDFVPMDPDDRRWVGMWWGGFLICGILLILVAIPFFFFPKVLTHERKKLRKLEMMQSMQTNASINAANKSNSLQRAPAPATATTGTASTQSSSTQLQLVQEKPSAQSLLQPPAVDAPQPPAQQQQQQPAPAFDTGYGQDIKDIPRSMWRLLSNPVYITTCLGACMELMIVSGFIVFLPKYLETQFSLGKSQASVFTGSIAIPGACIGIFMGGCILKRFQLTPRGAVQFVLISNLVCLSCYTLLFFLGCENLKMAGTTIPYYNQSPAHAMASGKTAAAGGAHGGAAAGGAAEPFQVNLTAACNFGCECRMTDVEPVCGNNGLTYFSPCHAGCTAFSSAANYTNCACVHANVTNFYAGVGGGSHAQASVASADFAEVTVVPVATAGPCTRPCRTIYPFLILLFFMTFIVAGTQMPLLMIVLRSVSEEERSFALGMQFVIFRLFGYIPAPILFGNLIDSTCLLWKSTCGEKGGRCLIYNIEAFRYKYVGLCSVVKIVALVIFGIDWWLVTRRKCGEEDVPIAKDEMSGSLLSLNNACMHRCTGTDSATDQPHHYADCCAVGLTASAAGLEPQTGSKRTLIATHHRHLRNDSKTIQLEVRSSESDTTMAPNAAVAMPTGVAVAGGAAGAMLPPRAPPPSAAHRQTHYRSSSCDVKMMRDELPAFKRATGASKAGGHSRTNSRDLDFRAKLTHSRQNSTDRHNTNIKYILNYLNTPKLIVPAAQLLADAAAGGAGAGTKKQHQRNHSYDQIYTPQNIRIDQEFQRRFNNNVARKNSTAKAALPPGSVTAPPGADGQPVATQTAEDIAAQTAGNNSATNVLRHRRTGSRDMNRESELVPLTAPLPTTASPKHERHGSQFRIQIDELEAPAETDTDAVAD